MNIVIGCDFHSRFQQLAMLDNNTGEFKDVVLEHADQAAVEAFYRQLPDGAVVVMEATAYTVWFSALLDRLGIRLVYGDAAKLAASRVRKQKHDRGDARHILLCYLNSIAFPVVHLPGERQRDLRQLLSYRQRLVRSRTRFKNGVHQVALNHGLARRGALFQDKHRQRLFELPLSGWERIAVSEQLSMIDQLSERVATLDAAVKAAVEADPLARRLMTHPGVGPVTALAWVQFLGDCSRFANTRKLASYLGFNPCEDSSAGKQRLGRISKQGNSFLRGLLVECAQTAVRGDPALARRYRRMVARKKRPIAKVAIARHLMERMYWMCRRGVDYPMLLR